MPRPSRRKNGSPPSAPCTPPLPPRPEGLPHWAADLEARLLKGEGLTPAVLKTLQGGPMTWSEAAALTARERLACLAIIVSRVRAEMAREGVTEDQVTAGAGLWPPEEAARLAAASEELAREHIRCLVAEAEREGGRAP